MASAWERRVISRERGRRVGQSALIACLTVLTACSPKTPPPDLVKTQRQTLDRAKAVEDVLRKQSEDRRRSIDDASR